MKISFHQLLQYCFNELSYDQRLIVERELVRSRSTSSALSGINVLKHRLGSREAVERYVSQAGERTRKRLFREEG